jgi:catechol 2,3-dioxygenase-like lactoylglutathione lyase family enzyme
MLANATYHATLPCSDFERAKVFYSEKLGLTPASEEPGGAFYESNGTRFLLFPSSGVASATHTQLGFAVDDIAATVNELKQRGVKFEEYDFPGFDTATSIATAGDVQSAWFKDSEGNLLGIVQLPQR